MLTPMPTFQRRIRSHHSFVTRVPLVWKEWRISIEAGRSRFDSLEDRFVVRHREHKRLSRMPDDSDLTSRIGRVEDLLKLAITVLMSMTEVSSRVGR